MYVKEAPFCLWAGLSYTQQFKYSGVKVTPERGRRESLW